VNARDAQFNLNTISLIFASCANNNTMHQKLEVINATTKPPSKVPLELLTMKHT
jgi:hypothetical protein